MYDTGRSIATVTGTAGVSYRSFYSNCYRYCGCTIQVVLQQLLQVLRVYHTGRSIATATGTEGVPYRSLYSNCYRYCGCTIQVVL